MLYRRKGFTLIELLVVIAIIGILAAMLFPVFARARESARKVQCLSNVKNIAMAIQMYISDYDAFMPLEKDKYAADYFDAVGNQDPWPNVCNHARQANPYLKEPVILDEYIKNRDVWRCASARVESAAESIVPVSSTGNWVDAFKIDHPDWKSAQWGETAEPCADCWPSGWGGDVTDSFVQGFAEPDGPGVAMFGIGINDNMHWDRPASINDVSRYIVCGDTGYSYDIWNAKTVAYPDYACAINKCGWDNPGCCNTSPDSGNTAGTLTTTQKQQAILDANFRRTLSRHMGGVNLGFADGHAKWYPSETVLWGQQPSKDAVFEGGLCYCTTDWQKTW